MNNAPQTKLEQRMRDDVRQLREREEKQALAGIREGYRDARRSTLRRMDDYEDRFADKAKQKLDEKTEEIARDEKREEHGEGHDKNHGMQEFQREMIEMIRDERAREKRHVQRDMDHGDREDYRRATEGMRDNQKKDEEQIVRLTRYLSDKKQKSWFNESLYPNETGTLLKAERDVEKNVRPQSFASVRVEFPRKKGDVKHFEEEAFRDLENHPAFQALQHPKDATHSPLSKSKLQHIANVASTMGRIAMLHPSMGLDSDTAWLTGATHDMFDESLLRKKGTDESRRANPRWFWATGHDHHGALAAARAEHERKLGPEWIDAIRHHSTGTHRMTPHMKVMLISDSITPDRGNSPELQHLRRTAFRDPHEAVRMLINALHHSVLRGHGHNKIREGLTSDPFRPHTGALQMYQQHDDDDKPTGQHPDSMATIVGLSPQNVHSPYGNYPMLDFSNPIMRRVLGSAFMQIDDAKDKPEAFATWLTARNAGGGLFRTILPAIWPLIAHKYSSLIRPAEKDSKGQSETTLSDIAALSKLMNAGSSRNILHIRRHISPEWLEGKHAAPIFIMRRHMKFTPFVMPPRAMHKSIGTIEELLPESLREESYHDWRLGERALA